MNTYTETISEPLLMELSYIMDRLLVFKLIEQLTGNKIEDDVSYYQPFNLDYMSYEDYYETMSYFLEKTNIGSFASKTNELEFFTIELDVLKLLQNKKNEMNEIQKGHYLLLIEQFKNMFYEISFADGDIDDLYPYMFNGWVAGGQFNWHTACEKLVKIHIDGQNILKEMEIIK